MYFFSIILLLCIIQCIVGESSSPSSSNPSAEYLDSAEFAKEFTFFTKDQSSTQCLIDAYEKYIPQGCGYVGELEKAVFTVALLSCKMEVLHGEPIACDLSSWLNERLLITEGEGKNNNPSIPTDSTTVTNIPRSLYKYCNKDGGGITTTPSFTTESWLTMNNHIDNLCYFAESRLWRQQAQQTSLLLLHSANSSAVTLQLIANESEQLRENTIKALDEAHSMRQQVMVAQAELYNLSESTKGTYQSVGGVLERIVHYTEATLWIQSTMMTNYYFLECIGFYGLLSYLLWFITAQPQARKARFTLIIGIIICAIIEYFMISDRIRTKVTTGTETLASLNVRIVMNETVPEYKATGIPIVNATTTPTTTEENGTSSSIPGIVALIFNLTYIVSFTMDWFISPFLTLCSWIIWLIYTPILYLFRFLISKLFASFFSGSFANEMEYVLSSAEFHTWSIQQRIWLIRSIFVIYSGIVILYHFLTYIDYSQLNYNMLTELREETRTLLSAVKNEVTKMAAIKASVSLSPYRYGTGNHELLEITDENDIIGNRWIPSWLVPWVDRILPFGRRRRRRAGPTTPFESPSGTVRPRRSSGAENTVSLLSLPSEIVDTMLTTENNNHNDDDPFLDPDYDPSRPDDILPPSTGYTNPVTVEMLLHDELDNESGAVLPPVHPAAGVGLFPNVNVAPPTMDPPSFTPLRTRNDYSLRPRDTSSGLALSGMINRTLFSNANVHGNSTVYINPIIDYETPEAFSLLVGLSQRASAFARSLWSRVNPVHDPTCSHTLPNEGIDSIDTDNWTDSESDDDSINGSGEDSEDESSRPYTVLAKRERTRYTVTAETLDSEEDDDSIIAGTRQPVTTLTRTPHRTIVLHHQMEEQDEDTVFSTITGQGTVQRRRTGGTKSRSSTIKKDDNYPSNPTDTVNVGTTFTPLISLGTGSKRARAHSTTRK